MITGATMFGRMCLKKMWNSPAPTAWAASTNWRARTEMTADRTVRADENDDHVPTTTTSEVLEAPTTLKQATDYHGPEADEEGDAARINGSTPDVPSTLVGAGPVLGGWTLQAVR